MGKKGRPKKSEQSKKLHGTFRKDRVNPPPAKRPKKIPLSGLFTDLPKKPSSLTGGGAKLWKELGLELIKNNKLNAFSLPMFIAMCWEYGHVCTCDRMLKKEGLVCTTPRGVKKANPRIAMRKDSFKSFEAIANDFGLKDWMKGYVPGEFDKLLEQGKKRRQRGRGKKIG